jgi:hypothetical protein
MTFGPSNTLGPFLPINQVFSQDEKQRIIQHKSRDDLIARTLNIREIAIYDLNENPTGEQWFNTTNQQNKKGGFRKVLTIGALAAGTVNTIPHGIVNVVTFTHIYGTGITTTAGVGGNLQVPLPYVSAAANANIDLKADPTNVYLILGAAGFSLSSAIIVLEYLKN